MPQLRELAREATRNLRRGGPGVVLELLSRGYYTLKPMRGDPVTERDWDLLVVLDACRADLWNEVAPEVEGFDAAPARTTVGGTSTEFLAKTFGRADAEWLAGTAYVTGNPYTDSHVDADAFACLDEVWRYAWDDEIGTIPARPVTDRAIAAGRELGDGVDRTVVHYMQPHFPCVPDADGGEGIALDRFGAEPISVWEELRFGERDPDEVWARYRENLRYVLAEVALLLENFDAERVAITADHGNAVGEKYLYGHVERVALPALREVPWFETSAVDRATYEPAEYERGESAKSVEDRLTALGYKE